MSWTMRRATEDDLDAVVDVLNQAGGRLADRGLDQWGRDWMTRARMADPVRRGETHVACDTGGRILATVTLSPRPDEDFWGAAEREDQAVYLSKLARIDGAPAGIGTWIASVWAPTWAHQHGYDLVRLDAWRTNRDLHDYYIRTGWTYLRTENRPGRRSGALFQRPAVRASPGHAASSRPHPK